jgi:hypothetical protein
MIALGIVAVLVIVALVIGISNVAKIGKRDGTPAAVSTAPATSGRTQPTTSAPAVQGSPTPTPTTTSAAPVTITGGTGYDEQDGTESDREVKNVFDGDPSTGWRSRWYGSSTFNGDKEGLGVILDLSAPTAVTEVELSLPAKQDVTVYLTDGSSRDGAQRVGSAKGAEGTVKITPDSTLKPGSKLIVFITKAAPAEARNHYRAQINEVTVR